MRVLVHKVFLREPCMALKSTYVDRAEWDQQLGVLFVGDLVLPLSATREFVIKHVPVAAPTPEASTTPPAEMKRPKK